MGGGEERRIEAVGRRRACEGDEEIVGGEGCGGRRGEEI